MRCYHKLEGGRWVPTPGEAGGGGGGGGLGRAIAQASEEREGDRPDSAYRRTQSAKRRAARDVAKAQRAKNREAWAKNSKEAVASGGAAQWKKDLEAARAFMRGGK
jgi:hypothetical protein